MNIKEEKFIELKQIISQNGGYITAKQVREKGIHPMYLKMFAETGYITKTFSGLYQKSDTLNDDLFDIQFQYPAGIFSYETALYIHGLAERYPYQYSLTFKKGYHSNTLKNYNITPKYTDNKLYELEIVKGLSLKQKDIKVYSPERTLCEILKTKAHTDIQVIIYAFKTYFSTNYKNKTDIGKLCELSKIFKVQDKVYSYIEVLS